MDIIGLPHDIMDRYPAELSGGQAQRVGIAAGATGWASCWCALRIRHQRRDHLPPNQL